MGRETGILPPGDTGDNYTLRPHWQSNEILLDNKQILVPEADADHIRQVLFFDLLSEFDARIFSAHIDGMGLTLSDSFQARQKEWLIDEANHFDGFRIVNLRLGRTADEMEASTSGRFGVFDDVDHLLTDEFSTAVLLAYDEMVTVEGYRADLEMYDSFGEEMSRFIRLVIADEAQHYYKFLSLLKNLHSHRLGEVDEKLKVIREADAALRQKPYAATFVLDHEEAVFTDELLDGVVATLKKQLSR